MWLFDNGQRNADIIGAFEAQTTCAYGSAVATFYNISNGTPIGYYTPSNGVWSRYRASNLIDFSNYSTLHINFTALSNDIRIGFTKEKHDGGDVAYTDSYWWAFLGVSGVGEKIVDLTSTTTKQGYLYICSWANNNNSGTNQADKIWLEA